MKLTLWQVKHFLEKAEPDEVIGHPMESSYCLVATCLKDLYPDCQPFIPASNETAIIRLEGEEVVVELDSELTDAADHFDHLPEHDITRKELEDLMPELFTEDEVSETFDPKVPETE